jgi:hypothetical protein
VRSIKCSEFVENASPTGLRDDISRISRWLIEPDLSENDTSWCVAMREKLASAIQLNLAEPLGGRRSPIPRKP